MDFIRLGKLEPCLCEALHERLWLLLLILECLLDRIEAKLVLVLFSLRLRRFQLNELVELFCNLDEMWRNETRVDV